MVVVLISGDGYVYSWGRGMFGRLGTGFESDELFPVRVKFKDPKPEKRLKFVGVAAGAYHSLALAGQFLLLLSCESFIFGDCSRIMMICCEFFKSLILETFSRRLWQTLKLVDDIFGVA